MRTADTYRAARRNACKLEHGTWGPTWYYASHKATIKRQEPKAKIRPPKMTAYEKKRHERRLRSLMQSIQGLKSQST